MANEADLEGIQRAGAYVAEDDPQRGDDQNASFPFDVSHEQIIPSMVLRQNGVELALLTRGTLPPNLRNLQARRLHKVVDGLLGFGSGLKARKLERMHD